MLPSSGFRNGHLSFVCSGVVFPPSRCQHCGVSGNEQDSRECVTDLSMHTETNLAGLWAEGSAPSKDDECGDEVLGRGRLTHVGNILSESPTIDKVPTGTSFEGRRKDVRAAATSGRSQRAAMFRDDIKFYVHQTQSRKSTLNFQQMCKNAQRHFNVAVFPSQQAPLQATLAPSTESCETRRVDVSFVLGWRSPDQTNALGQDHFEPPR